MQEQFSHPLLVWFDQHGRKDLPWQHPRSAYRVWIAEIMLQQTQVKTVIPYFNRFMDSFPNIWQLAQAHEDQVLAHWSGLGYYSRARNLFQTAKIICERYAGELPVAITELVSLPGIGPSTAAAIASQAFNQKTAILDGNVQRVLCRYFLIDGGQSASKQRLWQLANQCMPAKRCADYTQAIMDLGAICCTTKQPNCASCPVQNTCLANIHHKTAFYPPKKLKKNLPVKQQQFLLFYTEDNKIYLEKRPPTGLWGGLWCLPVINDITTCPIDYVANNYALVSQQKKELMTIKHTFSHFHLYIKALALKMSSKKNKLAECPGSWFTAAEFNKLGLAKPISDILNYFLKNHLSCQLGLL
jgi:A/G-specific adenine glycosylase